MQRLLIGLIALLGIQFSAATANDWFPRPIIAVDWPPSSKLPPLKAQRRATFAALNHAVLPEYQFKMFRFGGFLDFDITPKTMQKTMPGEEENYFVVSNAGVNIEADLASWFSVHLGGAYYQTNKGQGDYRNNTGVILDDAWGLFADYSRSPLYLEAGRFYLPFGIYNRYAISPTLPQMLEESRGDGLQGGILDWYGWSASVYVIQGSVTHDTLKLQGDINSGFSLIYQHVFDNGFGFGAGVQYIYNMLNNNSLREGGIYGVGAESGRAMVYQNRSDGIAAQGHVDYGPVTVFADYVSALQTTNNLPLLYVNLTANPANNGRPIGPPILGARPSAWDVGTILRFTLLRRPSQVDFSFQRSYQTNGLVVFNAMPNHAFPYIRYFIGGSVDILKNAYVRIQWGHNFLYAPADGDTGRQGDNATIRLGARF